jgi:hypothetical protein
MTLRSDVVETNQWLRVEAQVERGHDRVQTETPKRTYVTYSHMPSLIDETWYTLLIQQSPYVVGQSEYREMYVWLDERAVIKETFQPLKMQCWLFAKLTESQMFEFRVRWL